MPIQAGVVIRRSAPDPAQASSHRYSAEIQLPIEAEGDVLWIGRSLNAAGLRLRRGNRFAQVLSVVYSHADQRLSCTVAATCREDVRDLFEIALLPPARVLEETEG